jgi:enamine deaminase RidA (YjgF/YER057c/UK114 family)
MNLDADTRRTLPFLSQAEQVFRNIKAAVEAVGGNFSDVVKLNYFCVEGVDPSLIPQILKVRDAL